MRNRNKDRARSPDRNSCDVLLRTSDLQDLCPFGPDCPTDPKVGRYILASLVKFDLSEEPAPAVGPFGTSRRDATNVLTRFGAGDRRPSDRASETAADPSPDEVNDEPPRRQL